MLTLTKEETIKTNTYQSSKGKCCSCGDDKKEFTKPKKGKVYPKHKFYRLYLQTGWFRGDDEYLGTFCKLCLKDKRKEINK